MHQTRKGQQWYFGMKLHVGLSRINAVMAHNVSFGSSLCLRAVIEGTRNSQRMSKPNPPLTAFHGAGWCLPFSAGAKAAISGAMMCVKVGETVTPSPSSTALPSDRPARPAYIASGSSVMSYGDA